ncbi:restriction endonuclease [Tessaracoccus rhinocerotis]|uniref:Restriction endonuclease n=1 Tax=Tessaracoccus rhinocerotis TaxID=1689449 RepID=A0A553JZE3_9ACTN|nr:restriction endonuclease [Tessaracoccus rhinocerotis]TRY17814.1 restriction endonuclease [Tessaracoccus rhinocerotis]
MSMPTWQQFMAPVLRALLDGRPVKRRELYEVVAADVGITDEQRAEVLASGQVKFENRIGWATSYLNRVGALQRPERATYRITEEGRALLARHPAGIEERHLGELTPGGVLEWRQPRRAATPEVHVDLAPVETELDPVEQVSEGIARIQADVAADLLARLHAQAPTFFEKVVVDLLVAMGYGGAGGRETVTQASNDGGIDGVIDQDALGLNRVYVQAKRYALDSSVGRPEVQAFVGALSGRADGGVFITTARFSSGAQDYARTAHSRIILIDGARLASLMIRYGVGVQVKQTLHIVEVDEDFFE